MNFKSANILLDDKFEPLISDCGLASLLSDTYTAQVIPIPAILILRCKNGYFIMMNYLPKYKDVTNKIKDNKYPF